MTKPASGQSLSRGVTLTGDKAKGIVIKRVT